MTVLTSFLTLKGLDLLAYGLLFGILYYVGVVVWRLFFHPLSKFPGPRLAAATRWYEFYQDVVLGGVTPKGWPELHKRYGMLCYMYRYPVLALLGLTIFSGPILRTAPETLHINAPEFYQEYVWRVGKDSITLPDRQADPSQDVLLAVRVLQSPLHV